VKERRKKFLYALEVFFTGNWHIRTSHQDNKNLPNLATYSLSLYTVKQTFLTIWKFFESKPFAFHGNGIPFCFTAHQQ
jgi:hypothetical protein